jgi:hypothetical protein
MGRPAFYNPRTLVRRLAIPLLVSAVLAATPTLAAASEDLPSLLVTPAGGGWEAAGSEAMTSEDIVTEYSADVQSEVRGELQDDGFTAGWKRDWQQGGGDTAPQFEARVFTFRQWFGPAAWFASTKGDYEGDPDLKAKYATPGLANGFAADLHHSDGSDDTVVQFHTGTHFFELTLTDNSGPDLATVLATARAISSRAPASQTAADLPDSTLLGIGIAAGIFGLLVVVAAFAGFFIWLARRKRRPAIPATFLSPDGNWWWNGTQWVPAAGQPPRPPL